MLFLTFGFYLFVLPFYPARCIRCGINRGAVRQLTVAQKALVVGLVILGLGFIFHGNSLNKASSSPTKMDVTETQAAVNTQPSPLPATIPGYEHSDEPDEIISVNASELLSNYELNEQAADTRYRKSKIRLTGPLTQIFIPSLEQQMRMAEKY
jgi:hypothetical protein